MHANDTMSDERFYSMKKRFTAYFTFTADGTGGLGGSCHVLYSIFFAFLRCTTRIFLLCY